MYIQKRLLIRCSEAIATASVDLDACWYEFIGSDRYFRLWVGKGKYTPIYEERDLGYQRTLTTTIAPISSAKTGFEAQIEHADLAVQDAVRRIVKAQTSADGRSHIPSTILDFCDPEVDDRTLQAGEWYTVRTGRIFHPEMKGGSVGWGDRSYGEGFSLKFEELNKRRRA